MRAAARKSSSRPLVQEPIKTRSTATSTKGVPAFRPMYSRARSSPLRSCSLSVAAGSGTVAVIGATIPGLVPQLTYGTSFAASITSSRSNFAPGSVGNLLHSVTAAFHASPFGLNLRGTRAPIRVVGYGLAKKEQVQFMVARLLELAEAPEPPDRIVAAGASSRVGSRQRQPG